MNGDATTTALLSQALVAFTIEVDNEMERRMPHFTIKHGSITPGFGSPWLISVGVWFNTLRHVGSGMTAVTELVARSGMPFERVGSAIAGLVRWGYARHHAHPNDSRPKPPKRDWVVIPTTNGVRWHTTFPEVIAHVESEWRSRHGADSMSQLVAALVEAPGRAPAPSPPFMPLLTADHRTPAVEPDPVEPESFGLVSLLSRALLSHAYAVEPGLPLGLSLTENLVRVAAGDGELVRDLPRRSGVAKQEATTMLNFLVRRGLAVVEPDPRAKGAKRVRLTDAGASARDASVPAVADWDPPGLRDALARVEVDPAELHSTGGWRSKVKPPETLPHYPVVTGHGGFPDGS